MIYTFALWISNDDKGYRVSMYREVTANSEHEAYKEIVEDAYNYYMEDGDYLDKIVLIEIKEGEDDDTDRVERE